jgi:hypothetical protein
VKKIMLIRHGEKPGKGTPPNGVTADGVADPESLIVRGWQRAGALVELFDLANGPLRPGLAVPRTIFACGTHRGGSKRPVQTVTPLAERLSLEIGTRYGKGEESALVDAAKAGVGDVLICWRHDRIPDIADLILGHGGPPQQWPEDCFDLVWVFDLDAASGKYSFHQMPQLLLAGDRAVVIER